MRFEDMRLLSSYERVAKVYHWCERCCTDIHPGEQYSGEVYAISRAELKVFKKHSDRCDEPEEPESTRPPTFDDIEKQLRRPSYRKPNQPDLVQV